MKHIYTCDALDASFLHENSQDGSSVADRSSWLRTDLPLRHLQGQFRFDAKKRLFLPVSGARFREEAGDPPELLIDPFIQEKSLTMFAGVNGAGKTAFLFTLAFAAANGLPFCGTFAVRRRAKVLFWGQERSRFQYASHYKRILTGLGGSMPIEPSVQTRISIDVYSKEPVELYDLIKREGYDLVVIDSLSALSSAEENSNSEMQVVMARLQRILDFECAVIFSHHIGKANPQQPKAASHQGRGASAIPDYCESAWNLSRTADGERLTVKNAKSGGIVPEGTGYEFDFLWDSERVAIRSRSRMEDDVADVLKRAGRKGMGRKDIVDALVPKYPDVKWAGLEQRVKRALAKLGGSVEHEGQGKPYVWNGKGSK